MDTSSRRQVAFLSILVFMYFFGIGAARADDASCAAAAQAYVNSITSSLSKSYPYFHLDGVAYTPLNGVQWNVQVNYHYGQSAPGSSGNNGTAINCGLGETPVPPQLTGQQICAEDAPSAMRWVKGKILNGYSANLAVTDPSSGATVNCKMDLEPAGPPLTSDADGWYTLILMYADSAGWGSVTPPGAGALVDTSGAPAGDSDLPASGSSVSSNQTAPQVCGGGSCYDPNSGQACAVIGGKQACISVPQSAAAASAPGDCAAVGNGALCQGNPSPQPVKSVITDPATQIKSSDSYVFADPTSGQTFQDGVTVYTLPGTSAASGQKSGDVGPAPASTAAGNPSSYSGGTDCSTPPVCTGDAATCGAARTEWATVCQVHTDLAGTSSAPSPASLASGGSYDQSSLWVDNTSTGDAVADAANAGNYDQSGMGFSTTTCPMKDLTVPLGSASFVIPFSEGCVIGPWLRGIVIAMSLFAAAKITAGGNG